MESQLEQTTIRDEGYRILRTKHGHATAGYRIQHVSDGTFLVSIRAEYNVGDFRGFGSPRIEMQTRDECVTHFLEQAHRHFTQPLTGSVVTDSQKTAQQQMLAHLETGLFGFLEPDPEEA